MLTVLDKLTNRQLIARFNNLTRRINKAFAGGTQFGVDLPTLAACEPDLYNEYVAMRAEGRRRKQAGIAPTGVS